MDECYWRTLAMAVPRSQNVTQTDRYRTVFRRRHIRGRKSSEKIFHQDGRILLEDFFV